jgi:hypothetical protein
MDKENKRRSRRPVDRAISYQAVFSSAEGEKVLHDLMRQHHMLGSTFCKDPYDSAFKEGERAVVLRILQLLKLDVEKLAKRIDTALKEEEAYN